MERQPGADKPSLSPPPCLHSYTARSGGIRLSVVILKERCACLVLLLQVQQQAAARAFDHVGKAFRQRLTHGARGCLRQRFQLLACFRSCERSVGKDGLQVLQANLGLWLLPFAAAVLLCLVIEICDGFKAVLAQRPRGSWSLVHAVALCL